MSIRLRRFIYIIAALILIVLLIYWQNNSLQISKYQLVYKDLPESFDGYRIIQISDLHGKTFGAKNSTLVKKIKSMEPDIIFVTGDMMSSTKQDGGAFLDFLELFDQLCPVYMCLGNHEQIAMIINGNDDMNQYYNAFINTIKDKGVVLLDNEHTTLGDGGDKINLSGLTLALYQYSRRDKDYYDENMFLTQDYMLSTLGEAKDGFNILLAHNPAYFDEYEAWGADLVLSGHVHGGIVQIPFKGGLLSPEHVFFPEYDAGLFELADSKMIINRGLGNSVINLRLFNRPEITFIELIKW